MTVTVKIQKLRDVPLPAYMTPGAAAMDVAAAIDAPVTLPPHTPVMLPLGFAIALPEGYVGLMFGRSSMGAKYGVCPANAVGVIDSDYRGELRMTLINHTDAPVTVEPGQRVGQLMVLPVEKVSWEECEALPETARGAGGYGSTGK
ncbi:MAG: dUTP diphosphatase [Eubacteriales bacterium]|nr:dUTP diphosphatase [Eubacteriales bacterium]